MQTAFILLTAACDRDCDYCINRAVPPRPGGALAAAAQTVVARLADLGVSQVIFTGGEPTTVPELAEWIERCSQAGMGTLLLTNGDTLASERVSRWAAAGLDAVSCTVNDVAAAVPPAADQLCRQVRERIAVLQRGGITAITMVACVTRHNGELIERLEETTEQAGAGLLLQPLYLPTGHQRAADGLDNLTEAEWELILPALEKWTAVTMTHAYMQLWMDLYRQTPARPVSCFMGSETMVIDPDGSVFPCFHRRDVRCGNIVTDAPRELLLRLYAAAEGLENAPCFGKHCLPLFVGG